MSGPKQCIVITGGASGLGLETARSFAKHENHICVLDVSKEGEKIVAELASTYPQASFSWHYADITDWEGLARTFEEIYSQHQRIDVVLANAGISREAKITIDEEKPTKPNLTVLDINLTGTIYTIKLATHYMMKNKVLNGTKPASKGTIICTASIAGVYRFPFAPLYAASKHGVVGLVRSLAPQLAKESIQISAVAPAFIKTGLSKNVADQSVFANIVLTPIGTFVQAVHQVLSDPHMAGELVVAHGESVTHVPATPFPDEDTASSVNYLWSAGVSPAQP